MSSPRNMGRCINCGRTVTFADMARKIAKIKDVPSYTGWRETLFHVADCEGVPLRILREQAARVREET